MEEEGPQYRIGPNSEYSVNGLECIAKEQGEHHWINNC